MSGGKGSRLRPLTCDIPKPMVPILNKPVMEYIIDLLKKNGINDIAVTLSYLPSVITEYFEDGKKWNVNIQYFIEETPLGTGGSVKNAEDFLDSTFVVISGDAFTDINIIDVLKYHKEKKSKATLVLKREPVPLEYGVIITDNEGRIVRFLEKPSWGEVFSDTINTGIYVLEPEVLNYFDKGDNFDFSKDLFPKLLKDNVPMYGYVTDNYWSDIGDLSSYLKTQWDILNKKIDVNIDYKEIKEGVWIGQGTEISNDVQLNSPLLIGKNCTIKRSAIIDKETIIGDNCFIDEKSIIKKSIIWKNSHIGKMVQCSGAVVCNNVHIDNGASIFESSVIGKGSVVSANATISPNIKIWPEKKIEQNAVVNDNLVWGTKKSKTLFGFRGISGNVNIDITPEFSSKLGTAFASTIGNNNCFVVGCDENNASILVKNSVVSGLLSTGVSVVDINKSSIPMCRFAIRNFESDGGIHVRADLKDENKIHIELMDRYGANISRNIERKIENIFSTEDFSRCNSKKIKDLIKVNNFSTIYIKKGIELIGEMDDIKINNPIVIIGSKNNSILNTAADFLKSIGCSVLTQVYDCRFNSEKKYLNYIVRETVKNKCDIGVYISEDGERISLVDEKGRLIENEKYFALKTLAILKRGNVKNIIAPYNLPNVIEKIAEDFDANVLRTKISPADVLTKMLKGGNEEDYLFQYILNFDGIWSIGILLKFLIEKELKLSELLDQIPEFYFIRNKVNCDWKDKGRIIREIIQEYPDRTIEMFEGLKIYDKKGWTLILPDHEKPTFNLYTEGFTEEYANELSTFFIDKINKMLKNQGQ